MNKASFRQPSDLSASLHESNGGRAGGRVRQESCGRRHGAL
jgi:hypothetical protein